MTDNDATVVLVVGPSSLICWHCSCVSVGGGGGDDAALGWSMLAGFMCVVEGALVLPSKGMDYTGDVR